MFGQPVETITIVSRFLERRFSYRRRVKRVERNCIAIS